MEWYWTEKVLLAIAIGILGIYYIFGNVNVFKKHGVIHVPAVPILGSIGPVLLRRVSFVDHLVNLYNAFPDAKYFGFYATTCPILMLRDPEIIKSVLTKDFEKFPDRRSNNALNDPFFEKNVFSLQGTKWRDARALLSPSFTSGKMKMMFTLMSECAADFAEFLSTLPESNGDLDVKDAFAKYTSDVIAACACGVKVNSMQNPTNKFFIYSKDMTSIFTRFRIIKFLFLWTFPRLANILHMRVFAKHITNFLEGIIKRAVHLQNISIVQFIINTSEKQNKTKMSMDDVSAHVCAFIFANFGSSSTAMAFVAREIATNPSVRKRLQREIDNVLMESNGEVTYEAINRLEYLNAVIMESLRLYPPVVMVQRLCAQTYQLPPALPGEKPITIEKGMVCWIPVFAIHRDAKYFDEPHKFHPERFFGSAYHNSPYYLPFGSGPRMCIGFRFAILQMKVLVFHLLARCELKPCATTVMPVRFKRAGLEMIPEDGFWLNIRPRSDAHPTLYS